MNAMLVPDDTAQVLSEWDRQAQEEAMFAAEAERVTILDSFGAALMADNEKAVRWRLPIEQCWLEDLRQIHAEPATLAEVKGQNVVPAGRGRQDEHRRHVDNITKPALKQISARIKDMLFPTGERNGDLKPSPFPELSNPDEVLVNPETGQPFTVDGPPGEDGQPTQVPMTAADVRKRETEMAEKKAGRMLQHLDDALQEGDYSGHGRAVIDDGCTYGTGVLEGPVPVAVHQASYSKVMVDGVPVPQIQSKSKTSDHLKHVDLWNFYPQPCRKITEAEHAFVLNLLTKKQVRELAKQPGFDKKQLNRLLGLDPSLGALGAGGSLVERDRILSPDLETLSGRYAVWKYRGPVPKDALIAAGADIDPDDHLTEWEGEVWFSQGIVIKIVPTDEESYCGRLPFYVWCYEKDPSCVFGRGVPRELRNDQESVNLTWSATKLNSLMSSAPQIGVIPGMLEPGNNGQVDLSMTKPRVWLAKADVTDIRQVMSVFEIPNHTQELLAVYERAKANGVERVMLPQMQEGSPTQAAKTFSGLVTLMNTYNIVQRAAAKEFDTEITLPAWSAWCRSYLLNGDDEEAKGDFNVIPKGESHLLIKDVQSQHIQWLTQLSLDPRFAPYFEVYRLLELNVQTLSIPIAGLLRNKETVEEELKAQQGQPDPEQMKTEALMKRIEADVKIAEIRAQNEMTIHQGQMQSAERDRLAKMTIADMEAELRMSELLAAEATDAERRAVQERIASKRDEVAQLKLGAEMRLKAEQVVQKDRQNAIEMQVESPVRLA